MSINMLQETKKERTRLQTLNLEALKDLPVDYVDENRLKERIGEDNQPRCKLCGTKLETIELCEDCKELHDTIKPLIRHMELAYELNHRSELLSMIDQLQVLLTPGYHQ